jgi:predicted acyltransferase
MFSLWQKNQCLSILSDSFITHYFKYIAVIPRIRPLKRKEYYHLGWSIMVSNMKSKLLIFLLAVSLVANAYFVLFEEQPSLEKGQVQEMQAQINELQKENENLQAQLKQDNESLKSYS